MLKNKKIMLALALPVLLFAGYSMTKPKPVIKHKVKGTIYVMPQTFLVNLTDGRYAKLAVALELAAGQSDGAAAAGASASEGAAGTLPEEPLVREIVTNAVTNQNGETLISAAGRRRDPAPDPKKHPAADRYQGGSSPVPRPHRPVARRNRVRGNRVRAVRADRAREWCLGVGCRPQPPQRHPDGAQRRDRAHPHDRRARPSTSGSAPSSRSSASPARRPTCSSTAPRSPVARWSSSTSSTVSASLKSSTPSRRTRPRRQRRSRPSRATTSATRPTTASTA